ncbi:ribonuclease Z [Methanomassiliicoccus luminyensis]|uniref:ribonuclease Z n=1 Tax=Methanomassiliicoccus luminyensis TaxID=1080712 RepID=UPI000372EA3B|nr:ribonuclease Z [Methanomassiliicoccus luminyensis]
MQLTFLGTGGGLPSPQRGVSAIALQIGRDVLLFDCGEGTQRQFMLSPVSFMKVSSIFISHFHGDHFLGLPGLIQSMNFSGRDSALDIYGPRGMIELAATVATLGDFTPSFPIRAGEMQGGDAVDFGPYTVTALESEHTIPSLSFVIEEKPRRGRFLIDRAKELGVPEGPMFSRLQSGNAVTVKGKTIEPSMVLGPPRKGRKVVISGDTRPTQAIIEAATGAEVLVHEATMDHSLQEGAREYGHSTAREAAEVAKAAGVGLLILTHISNRYDDASILEKEAQETFPHTVVATDLMSLPVRMGGKGPPGVNLPGGPGPR